MANKLLKSCYLGQSNPTHFQDSFNDDSKHIVYYTYSHSIIVKLNNFVFTLIYKGNMFSW